jgi:hypothetical protein
MSDGAAIETGSGRRVWLRWVAATALGVLIAAAGFMVVYSIIGEPGDALFPLLIAGVGATFGAFQQRVLRRALGDAGRWAVATGIGLGAGIALALAMGEGTGLAGKVLEGVVHGAAVGAIIGMLQWQVLRPRLQRARWWPPASIVGWAAGAAAGDAAGYAVDGLDIVVAPVVAAANTGVALAALLRHCQADRAAAPASALSAT